MKTDKIFKENTNYFKKNDGIKVAGVVLAVISAFLYFFGWGYVSYIIATIGLPAGIALFVVGSVGRSDESDLDNFIEGRMKGAYEPDPEDEKFEKRRLSHVQPLTAGGYEYSDGLIFRKDKNGHLRSSLYTSALLYPMKASVCIYGRTLSLISDEKTDIRREIFYKDIDSISASEEEKWVKDGKNSFKAKDERLVLKLSGGEIVSLPVSNGMDVDIFVKKISELVMASRSSEE